MRYEDSGRYVLEAKNCFGIDTANFRLKAFGPPKVTFRFPNATENISVANGSRIIVQGSLDGNFTLPYSVTNDLRREWFHNGSKLDASKYNASHLILRNIQLSDAGEYTIMVENFQGEVQESFWLSFEEAMEVHVPTTPLTTTTIAKPTTSTTDTFDKPTQNRTQFGSSLGNVTPTERVTTSTVTKTTTHETTASRAGDASGDTSTGTVETKSAAPSVVETPSETSVETTQKTPSGETINTIPIAIESETDHSQSSKIETPSIKTGTVWCFLVITTYWYTNFSSVGSVNLAHECDDEPGSCGGTKTCQTHSEIVVESLQF
jgi:hypothetical protein